LRLRWWILGLLFLSTVLNYVDRQTLSILAPVIQKDLHFSDTSYSAIVQVFLLAYTLAYLVAGRVTDRLGTRWSMALFLGWWSVANLLTGLARSARQLGSFRFLLGLGEAGNYTAAPKAVGEWFPPRERGLAIGIYTAGAMIGATIAPPMIAGLSGTLGWRAVFFVTGIVGLVWLFPWLMVYRKGPVDEAEREAPAVEGSMWRSVLTDRRAWLLMFSRLLSDPVWYFYLFWFPKYLLGARGLTLAQVAHIGWVVYLAAGIGTLAGGLFSGVLIRRGIRTSVAYRYTMLATACLMPLSPLCALVSSSTLAIGIASIIAFAHMSWLVTLTATIVELYPPSLVGRAAGLIAAGSGFGGMVSSEIIAYYVTHGGYRPVFFLMAVLHPVAIVVLWRGYTSREPTPVLSAA
jgi:MFS transporter, ACS family, hexuronate transporter